jgi:hypothetical protein
MTSFATLQRLARRPEPVEHCDLCGSGLAQTHQHLLDPAANKLICSCDACSMLFFESGETKYKRVPRRARLLTSFHLSDGQWDNLMIPIGLAFFVQKSTENRVVAQYPSPAGSTESLLPLDAWTDLVDENPILKQMLSDVEVLLVNRLRRPAEYYLAPIDKAYELVGLIRANWHGLSGGTEVWLKIHAFFERLREGSQCLT